MPCRAATYRVVLCRSMLIALCNEFLSCFLIRSARISVIPSKSVEMNCNAPGASRCSRWWLVLSRTNTRTHSYTCARVNIVSVSTHRRKHASPVRQTSSSLLSRPRRRLSPRSPPRRPSSARHTHAPSGTSSCTHRYIRVCVRARACLLACLHIPCRVVPCGAVLI